MAMMGECTRLPGFNVDATGGFLQLADEFHPLDAAFVVPGTDGMTVATYVVPPAISGAS